MKCKQVLCILSRFQDGECEENEKLEVASHLRQCKHCQQELNRLDQTLETIKGLEEAEPAQNFTAMIMETVKGYKRTPAIPLPSLLYSFVFILFFLLGLIPVLPFESGKISEKKELTMVQILMESQNLSQFDTQNKTISLFSRGESNEK